MATDHKDRNWFITERSEALASLLLTSRDGVGVHREMKHEDGVDLLVTLEDDSESVHTRSIPDYLSFK
jgi:hypothetical protein